SIASRSYRSRLSTASWPSSHASSTLVATRDANVLPRVVTIGTPAPSASTAVVCALYGLVSRKTSASVIRDKCWALVSVRDAKTRREGSTPRLSASLPRLFLTIGDAFLSHSTLSGTAVRTRIHMSNTTGEILYAALKQQ